MNFRGGPRWINLILGVWLIISAFIWPHTIEQRTNTWIVGLAIALVSLAAMADDRVRFLNTALAIWLFISAFALPSISAGTQWNNALVAIAVFIVSLAPATMGRPRPGGPVYQQPLTR